MGLCLCIPGVLGDLGMFRELKKKIEGRPEIQIIDFILVSILIFGGAWKKSKPPIPMWPPDVTSNRMGYASQTKSA